MEELESPLPEVDQQKQHPLRILSEENLTVVSTFAGTSRLIFHFRIFNRQFLNILNFLDSISVLDELDRLYPQNRWCSRYNFVPQPSRMVSVAEPRISHEGM